MPQKATNFNQAFPATVMEVVMSGRTGRRGLFTKFGPDDVRASENALEIMELANYKNHPITGLSGGQQQRVLIARALASEPDLLIMDEPTVGVDQSTREKLYTILKKLNREEGLTLVVVSHDIEGIAGFCTRQVCLNLHLCTCNSWSTEPGGERAESCGGLFPVYSNGRL